MANSTVIRSTGTCPAEWREYWAEQSRIDRTDWVSLLEAADQALTRLRAKHLVLVSS
jgi:hypothetical protein